MLTTLSRFRRQIAVLTALAMVASILVAAPATAADDPKADFEATFDACVGDATEDAGFTDVPEGHTNADDIDCIAYYTITKGTTATTYSPLMSVTREQMALFLTRLAGKVGIEMAMDSMDTGFTDIGDLSEESQTAIGQLKDLGITKGTSDTTYSPADPVTRGQMALFIARLMDNMTPMADGKIGLSSTTQYGYTPSDVAKNKDDKSIGTPFMDISGETPKEQYDAVTRLYELGVATGVSDTSYEPDANITRAAMAGFMAAAMDHSNLRPSGLSIQANEATVWGDTEPVVIASYRSDTFGAVEEQPIDVFSSTAPGRSSDVDKDRALRSDGKCNLGVSDPDDVLGGDLVDGDCVWSENDEATDKDGNLFVDVTEVRAGTERTFYAWINDKDGTKFDDDDHDQVTVAVTSKKAQDSLKTDSDINDNALNLYGRGQVVDLTADSSVTITVTLRDEDNNDVEREGVSIRVDYQHDRSGGAYVNTDQETLTTDENGQVSYTITGPENTSATNDRGDSVTFVELDSDGEATDRTATVRVHWIEETAFLASDSITVPPYIEAGNRSVKIQVHQWDQYGNPYRSHSRQKTDITVTAYDDSVGQDDIDDGTGTAETDIGSEDGNQGSRDAVRQVISRGYSTWSPTVNVANEDTIRVVYDVRQLARNSSGNPVRTGATQTAADTPDIVVGGDLAAQFTAWVGLGQSSAQSRKTVIDALRTTYNDARVMINPGADAAVTTDDTVLHPDEIDDDGDSAATTPALTDYAAPRGDSIATPAVIGSTDPFVYSRTSDAPDAQNAEWFNGLSSSALDTYQDYEGLVKSRQGLVNTDATDDDPSASDGMGTVAVVTKANSANTGLYNVDLEGPSPDPTIEATRDAYKKATYFLADTVGTEGTNTDDNADDTKPELVFSFDDDDIFIDNRESEGRVISIDMFRSLLKDSTTGSGYEVRVLTYNVDGTSTFSVRANSAD